MLCVDRTCSLAWFFLWYIIRARFWTIPFNISPVYDGPPSCPLSETPVHVWAVPITRWCTIPFGKALFAETVGVAVEQWTPAIIQNTGETHIFITWPGTMGTFLDSWKARSLSSFCRGKMSLVRLWIYRTVHYFDHLWVTSPSKGSLCKQTPSLDILSNKMGNWQGKQAI